MTCSWCEEEKELAELCNNENHRVCKECYSKYRLAYPLRVEGCPYCRGNEEKVVIRVEIPEEVEIPAVYIPDDRQSADLLARQLSYHGECDTHQISTTIAMMFIVLLLIMLIIRSYG